MGEIYEAEDVTLGRRIALKLLPEQFSHDDQAVERFRREARAISVLNHPHICTIYETGEVDGQHFLAMELLEGATLRTHMGAKALDLAEILNLAEQIADGLVAAHTHGVIHRDIKPENIFITRTGQIKILDFGLAKLTPEYQRSSGTIGATASTTAATIDLFTSPGSAVGTVAYMSPEQALGQSVDSRTDLFSFGTVLYEMACGRRPFTGETLAALTDSILHETPAPPSSINSHIPAELERVIVKALEKDRAKRITSAAAMRACFERSRREQLLESGASERIVRLVRNPAFRLTVTLALIVACVFGALGYRHYTRIRWLHEKAVPDILQLSMDRKGIAAFRLIKQAERYFPNDPALAKVKAATLWPNGVRSTPPGAEVYVRDYSDTRGDWEYLGKTPLQGTRLPHSFYAFKLIKQGYEPIESTGTALENRPVNVILDPVGSLPAGMVRIPPGKVDPTGHSEMDVDTFLMDKFEVTNRDYKKFVDAGGYRDPKYWENPFSENGRLLFFKDAMLLFRDKTDRPGPSTWELGGYPHGEDEYPVSGVSWYEAAAYARFVGKSLPTVFHWYRAADLGRFSDILQASNFSAKGAAKIGSYPSLGPFGTYDMAGNVKEWCLNSVGNRKYILGGASTDPPYMYNESDARRPFERAPTHGIRLVKYLGTEPLAQSFTAPVSFEISDYRKVTPVSAGVFRVYESLYAVDRTPLKAQIENVDDSSPYWRRQRITFDAAYGNERVIAYLFLPKSSSPPYQTVVYFPHGGAQSFHSVEETQLVLIDFIVKSGRALMFPIYKDTYERLGTPPDSGTNAEKEETIQQAKDLRRAVDYLESRSDIDSQRLAYYGISWGAVLGPVMNVAEKRFKAAIFVAGGCNNTKILPEIDPMNYAPRIKLPVLMINGRFDFQIPLDTCQEPFFRLLGTAPQDKKHVLFDTGHSPPQLPVMKEALNWLDRYLGQVK